MRSVNRVTLIGNLGKDAEQKFTPSGAAVANFSVATTRKWKDKQSGEWKEATDWHNIVLWNSEAVSPFLVKGKSVYVEGRLSTRSYDAKDGSKRYVTEVVADNLILLGDGGRTPSAAQPEPTAPSGGGADLDDIPF